MKNKMKKIWNYVFYFTWKILCLINLYLIEMPVFYILSLIPFFKGNIKKGYFFHRKILDGKQKGINIGFAFYCMLLTSSIIISSLQVYLVFLFGINLKNSITLKIFFIFFLFLSYFINSYFVGWKDKDYLNYFKSFEQKKDKVLGFVLAMFFHLGGWAFGVLSIYLLSG